MRYTRIRLSFINIWCLTLSLCLFGCCESPDKSVGAFSLNHDDVISSSHGEFSDRNNGRNVFKIDVELTFTPADGGQPWTAPVKTYTDWASIPDILLSGTGRHDQPEIARPALIHDAFCQEFIMKDGVVVKSNQYRTRPWEETHDMFYHACLASGASETQACSWWLAVRVGGPKWDTHGNTIDNTLAIYFREIINGLVIGPDGSMRKSVPTRQEMQQKLAVQENTVEEINAINASAISLAQAGDIETCGQVIDSAITDLDALVADDQESQFIYAALKGRLTNTVARELTLYAGKIEDTKLKQVALTAAVDQFRQATAAYESNQAQKFLKPATEKDFVNVNVNLIQADLALANIYKGLDEKQYEEKRMEVKSEIETLKNYEFASPVIEELKMELNEVESK